MAFYSLLIVPVDIRKCRYRNPKYGAGLSKTTAHSKRALRAKLSAGYRFSLSKSSSKAGILLLSTTRFNLLRVNICAFSGYQSELSKVVIFKKWL